MEILCSCMKISRSTLARDASNGEPHYPMRRHE
jgi:hypothetical protein